MKTRGAALATLGLALLLGGCSTVDVKTDFDHSAPFGTYRTFSFAPAGDGRKLPIYCDATLRNTIRAEMTRRGLTEMTGPKVDLAVVWHVFLEGKDTARTLADKRVEAADWPFAYGYYGLWLGAPGYFANTAPYPDGTLILDIVDMRTRKLAFRGTATAAAMGPERCASNVQKAVPRMVESLPATR